MRNMSILIVVMAFLWVSTHEVVWHTSNVSVEVASMTPGHAWRHHHDSASDHHDSNHHGSGHRDSDHHDSESHNHFGGATFVQIQKVVLAKYILAISTIATVESDSFECYTSISPDCGQAESALGIPRFLRTQRILI